jgi:DNA end-binding protein Ku
MKTKEHLAAVKAIGNMITLQTMRFSHEIVDASELNLPKAEISKKEMDLANTLIDSMTDKFEPTKYKDEYYEKVMAVVQAKVEGVAPSAPAAAAKQPQKVVDLMEVLKQSLKEAKKKPEPQPEHEETVTAGSARTRTRKAR